MTDDEIIKVLFYCTDGKDCTDCLYKNTPNCSAQLRLNVVELINRQKAEIERLSDYNANLQTANTALSNEILGINSEAIKEFAERLKDKIENARQKYQRLCKEQGEKEDKVMNIHFNGIAKIISDLVKEMTEENENY